MCGAAMLLILVIKPTPLGPHSMPEATDLTLIVPIVAPSERDERLYLP